MVTVPLILHGLKRDIVAALKEEHKILTGPFEGEVIRKTHEGTELQIITQLRGIFMICACQLALLAQ
jgi:hypothetical protein